MMQLSKELVDSTNAYRIRRRGDIETYARLEWDGHLGSLSFRSKPRARRTGWGQRLRSRRRRPAREGSVPAGKAPVVVHRVRIEPGVELLVSLAAPSLGTGVDFGGAPGQTISLIPAEVGLGARP